MINLIDYIDLSDWKTKKQIIFELYHEHGINISEDGREWREAVEKWNKKFSSKAVPFYITHSNTKGYKATTDYSEAKLARNDYIKRGVNMIKKARECDKAFNLRNNFQIDFETGELI